MAQDQIGGAAHSAAHLEDKLRGFASRQGLDSTEPRGNVTLRLVTISLSKRAARVSNRQDQIMLFAMSS